MVKKQIKRILCPIDFSEQSNEALSYAASLSQKLEAALMVMHAARYVPYVESVVMLPESYIEESEKRKHKAMDNLKAYIRNTFPDVHADYLIVDHYPIEGILDAISEVEADLVVMATTGRSGFKRLILGSVAEGVMQQTSVPVLTVRRSTEISIIEVAIQSILVPTNFTEPSARALEAALVFADTFKSRLTITHVVESGGVDEESVAERVRDWAQGVIHRGREFDVVVRRGKAAEQIIHLAQDINADLIAVAAVFRPFLETTIAGTTSERVVRFAPCPVLTVPVRQ